VDHGCLRKFDDSAKIQTQNKNQSLFTEPPYRLLSNPSTMVYRGNYIYMKTAFFFYFSSFIYQWNNILGSHVYNQAICFSHFPAAHFYSMAYDIPKHKPPSRRGPSYLTCISQLCSYLTFIWKTTMPLIWICEWHFNIPLSWYSVEPFINKRIVKAQES